MSAMAPLSCRRYRSMDAAPGQVVVVAGTVQAGGDLAGRSRDALRILITEIDHHRWLVGHGPRPAQGRQGQLDSHRSTRSPALSARRTAGLLDDFGHLWTDLGDPEIDHDRCGHATQVVLAQRSLPAADHRQAQWIPSIEAVARVEVPGRVAD